MGDSQEWQKPHRQQLTCQHTLTLSWEGCIETMAEGSCLVLCLSRQGRVTLFLLFLNHSFLTSSQWACCPQTGKPVDIWGPTHGLSQGCGWEPLSCPWALPCLRILKSLMPLTSAFLSSMYLLEILFSLLKRRFYLPKGEGRGGLRFYNSALTSTMFRREEKRRKNKLTWGTSAVSVKSLRSWCHRGIWIR